MKRTIVFDQNLHEYAKRLKATHAPNVPQMLLEQLPVDADRKERLDKALMDVVVNETKSFTPDEWKQFQYNVEKYQKDFGIEFCVYEVDHQRNCSWMGNHTWGCTFGREVACAWNVDHDREYAFPKLEDLRCDTKKVFAKLQDKFKTMTVGSFGSLESAADNCVANGDYGYDSVDIQHELMTLRKYMIEAKCLCVEPVPVIGVV